jgi:hypothetical protein
MDYAERAKRLRDNYTAGQRRIFEDSNLSTRGRQVEAARLHRQTQTALDELKAREQQEQATARQKASDALFAHRGDVAGYRDAVRSARASDDLEGDYRMAVTTKDRVAQQAIALVAADRAQGDQIGNSSGLRGIVNDWATNHVAHGADAVNLVLPEPQGRAQRGMAKLQGEVTYQAPSSPVLDGLSGSYIRSLADEGEES